MQCAAEKPAVNHEAEHMAWQVRQSVVSEAKSWKAQYKGILGLHWNFVQCEQLTSLGCVNYAEGTRNHAVCGAVSHD